MEKKAERQKKSYPFPPFAEDDIKKIDDSASPVKIAEIESSLVSLFGHKHGYSAEKIFKELEYRKFMTRDKRPITDINSTLYSLCTRSKYHGFIYRMDDYISQRNQKRKIARGRLLQNESLRIVERHDNHHFIDYSDQMSDARWKAFRKFVFAVRGSKCELCGSGKSLQVHHPKYIKGLKAWEYTCNQVIVVCRCCHEKIHSIPRNESK